MHTHNPSQEGNKNVASPLLMGCVVGILHIVSCLINYRDEASFIRFYVPVVNTLYSNGYKQMINNELKHKQRLSAKSQHLTIDTVQTIFNHVENLPLRLQTEVLDFVEYLIFKNKLQISSKSTQTSHSILELRGLGKHLWQDVSVKDYINAERDSWNG